MNAYEFLNKWNINEETAVGFLNTLSESANRLAWCFSYEESMTARQEATQQLKFVIVKSLDEWLSEGVEQNENI